MILTRSIIITINTSTRTFFTVLILILINKSFLIIILNYHAYFPASCILSPILSEAMGGKIDTQHCHQLNSSIN